jgi:predicted type IV restriction endonuclease
MSFDEKIVALIQRLPKLTDCLETEESTKNALVMPFISALGYDVFNPREVVPRASAPKCPNKAQLKTDPCWYTV